jgi:polysaccharide deacetylase 2 family uncharacterized protein YibQ
MGAGVFVGIFWGLVVSALVVTAVSLSAPLPSRSGEMPLTETADVTPGATEDETPAQDPAPIPDDMTEEAAETTAPVEAPASDDAPAVATSDVVTSDGATPDNPTTAVAPLATESAAADDTASPAPALADPDAADSAQPGQAVDGQRAVASDGVPLPAGSEFNRPPPEEAPVLPATDSQPTILTPSAPEASVPAAPRGLDTAPAPLPRIVRVPDTAAPAPLDTADVAVPGAEEIASALPAATPPPRLPQIEPDSSAVADAQSIAPPQTGGAVERVTDAETPEPEISVAETAATEEAPPPAPVAETVDQAGADTAPGTMPAETETETETDTPARAPVVVQLVPPQETAPLGMEPLDDLPGAGATVDGATGALPEPPRMLRTGDADPAPGAERALPQIVSPARNLPDTQDETSASDVPVVELDEAIDAPRDASAEGSDDRPAIEAFAAPFDRTETRPLISVILIDAPDDRLDIDTLTQFSFPVAFAIDPARPDAAERAAAYRAAGFEVLMMASVIPEGATASDTEVALSVARARVPEAVALIDTPDSRVQSDRVVLEAVVGTAAGEGQGLIAFPRGLNTAEQMAERAGVPAATLFRLLDDEDQRATVITRFLGRAEFAAVQEGAVIVAGRTRPDTVTALFSWALGDRNEGVAIAPVSAVLQRLAEDE